MPTFEESKDFLIWLLKLVGVIAVLVGIACSDQLKCSVYELKQCRYCYDQRWEKTDILGHKNHWNLIGGSDYWVKNVDPHHKHHWQHVLTGKGSVPDEIRDAINYRRYEFYSPVAFPYSVLEPQAMIAVLDSFKTPAERKAFAEKHLLMYLRLYYAPPRDKHHKDYQLQVKLQGYYDQNPARKDWQKILKRLKVI